MHSSPVDWTIVTVCSHVCVKRQSIRTLQLKSSLSKKVMSDDECTATLIIFSIIFKFQFILPYVLMVLCELL